MDELRGRFVEAQLAWGPMHQGIAKKISGRIKQPNETTLPAYVSLRSPHIVAKGNTCAKILLEHL